MMPGTILCSYAGWNLVADPFEDSDGFERVSYGAVHPGTGRVERIDMSTMGTGPTLAQFCKLIVMDFPTRSALDRIGPLTGADIDRLYADAATAPGRLGVALPRISAVAVLPGRITELLLKPGPLTDAEWAEIDDAERAAA